MGAAVFTYLALCMTPAVLFGLAFAATSPYDNRVKRFGGWVGDRVHALRSASRPPALPDPFEVLSVQMRLERLANEIADLEANPQRWARAHHLRAALSAYDDLLEEACRMAGAPLADVEERPVRRVLEEAELRSRGWTW